MKETKSMNAPSCTEIRTRLQDYLDGDLPRKESMSLFLHIRECDSCGKDLEEMQRLNGLLGGLPPVQPPEDFDARILESVPYAAYRAMEPLRRERMPVILDEEALPAFVRARGTRAVGGLITVLTAVGLATDALSGGWAILMVAGALPEALVLLQSASRRIYAGVMHHPSTR
ncbi:zf-HC2 domain-containing protein [bacterium]|nr:zf-HC2 domain-containing protein [bacterium]MBU1074320.1 zf-HC2 domain-containing protein [bacterium]MBU1676286.1 zf-HC2 domain-containing protein [bacterium]